jgi:hypothetical protein
MESLPHLDLMPRVGRDITRCLHFISQQPWGKLRDRELDIDRGIAKAWSNPMSAPVRYRVRSTGLELRRIQIAQFATDVSGVSFQVSGRQMPPNTGRCADNRFATHLR